MTSGYVYVGLCPGCGEAREAVLTDEYPYKIARMAMDGLIVHRKQEPLAVGWCFCPDPDAEKDGAE